MKQYADMPESLTDYEMLVLYNPYYFSEKVEQMKAEKEDLYYKSCSWTVYDQQEGIHRESISVENIVEKTIALETHIKKLGRMYKERRERLTKELEGWHRQDIEVLDTYFKRQLKGEAVDSNIIDHLKRELYPLEQQARSDRERERNIDKNAWIKEALEELKTLRGGEKDDERSENRKRASITVRTLGSVADDS